jgi:Ca-activated chloride channel homolog
MFRGFCAVVTAVVMSLPALSGAQPTFQSTTELVHLSVTVVDRHAQPVQGLAANQFHVFEDGVGQTVEFFAAGEMPADVVILLDMSGSMGAAMPLVRAAATRLVHALRPGDRASLMTISNGLRIEQPMTADLAAVGRAIASTKVGGRTPLYTSVYTALRELDRLRREEPWDARRQAMVMLTDGEDNASGFGFEELLDVVRRHAVPIYTIAPRPSETIKTQRELLFGETTHEQDFELRRLARETGARSFFPTALQELSGIYDAIAAEIAHQYALAYQSTNTARDGSFRRIALRVDAPGVQWRTRAGYMGDRETFSGGE